MANFWFPCPVSVQLWILVRRIFAIFARPTLRRASLGPHHKLRNHQNKHAHKLKMPRCSASTITLFSGGSQGIHETVQEQHGASQMHSRSNRLKKLSSDLQWSSVASNSIQTCNTFCFPELALLFCILCCHDLLTCH